MSEQDNDFREIIDASSDEEIKVEDENKEKDEYEDICYICRRPESVAGKMIHIPTDICICNDFAFGTVWKFVVYASGSSEHSW